MTNAWPNLLLSLEMKRRTRRKVSIIAVALIILHLDLCNSLKLRQRSRFSSQRNQRWRICSKNDEQIDTVLHHVQSLEVSREVQTWTSIVPNEAGENVLAESFTDDKVAVSKSPIENEISELLISVGCSDRVSQILRTARFLFRAATVGAFTGLSVVVFKSMIAQTQVLFYER
jgi:hypothetical protein